MSAHQGARTAAYDLTLEASPVAPLVRTLVEKQSPWQGTATALLAELVTLADEKTPTLRTWPKDGRGLSNALRRLAPTLRAVGVDVTLGQRTGKQGQRQISLSRITEVRENFAV